jgi:hypothetical protein
MTDHTASHPRRQQPSWGLHVSCFAFYGYNKTEVEKRNTDPYEICVIKKVHLFALGYTYVGTAADSYEPFKD